MNLSQLCVLVLGIYTISVQAGNNNIPPNGPKATMRPDLIKKYYPLLYEKLSELFVPELSCLIIDHLFEVQQWQAHSTRTGAGVPITRLAYGARKHILASTTEYGTLKIWRLANRTLLMKHGYRTNQVVPKYEPKQKDNRSLSRPPYAIQDKMQEKDEVGEQANHSYIPGNTPIILTRSLKNLINKAPRLMERPDPATPIFTPDNQELFFVNYANMKVTKFDLANYTVQTDNSWTKNRCDLIFAPTARFAFSRHWYGESPSTIYDLIFKRHILMLNEGNERIKEVYPTSIDSTPITAFTCSADNQLLICAHAPNMVIVWRLMRGNAVHEATHKVGTCDPLHNAHITAIACDPRNQYLVYGTSEGVIGQLLNFSQHKAGGLKKSPIIYCPPKTAKSPVHSLQIFNYGSRWQQKHMLHAQTEGEHPAVMLWDADYKLCHFLNDVTVSCIVGGNKIASAERDGVITIADIFS